MYLISLINSLFRRSLRLASSGVESRSLSVVEWTLVHREVGSTYLKSAYDTSSLALTLPIYSPFIVIEG